MSNDQDFKVVILRKRDADKVSEIQKKNAGGKNQQNEKPLARKFEEDIKNPITAEVDFKINRVSPEVSKQLQQARVAKKMTQDQLAKQLSMDVGIIKSYENGTAIPNGQILAKIKRKLAMK